MHMVLSGCTHSLTSWAEQNAIYSMNMCTAAHVRPQVTHVCAQVDLYHLCTDHPYKYTVAQKNVPMFAVFERSDWCNLLT